jgi:hypothetical protein
MVGTFVERTCGAAKDRKTIRTNGVCVNFITSEETGPSISTTFMHVVVY